MTDWILDSTETLKATLLSKNADYSPEGEFDAFIRAGKLAGVSVEDVMATQIGVKVSRLQSLLHSSLEPNNEPLSDTLLDLAGYAVIMRAWLRYMDGPTLPEE